MERIIQQYVHIQVLIHQQLIDHLHQLQHHLFYLIYTVLLMINNNVLLNFHPIQIQHKILCNYFPFDQLLFL
jgi:hypothetical protein